jgi:hypothetical protein
VTSSGTGRKLRQVMEDELELEKCYREMAADLEAEAEALEWIEGTMGDVGDEPWDEKPRSRGFRREHSHAVYGVV